MDILFSLVLATYVGFIACADRAAWWNVSATDIMNVSSCPTPACLNYETQALIITLQGIVNRDGPRLLYDFGAANVDFTLSDQTWKAYFEEKRNITFDSIEPQLCSLITHFKSNIAGAVSYTSDGYSIFLAMTAGGIDNLLPVSKQLSDNYPCLSSLPVAQHIPLFNDKFAAYAWGTQSLLPNCSNDIVYNADYFAGSDNGAYTLMSADYPIANKAFIMNFEPCWEMVDLPPCNSTQKQETQLFMNILKTRNQLVSVWGWSDPEHAYTNATTVAGGVVFCTFSTANLAFWAALGKVRGTVGVPVPQREPAHTLDPNAVYITFETNEGDTPRILTAQFTSQWLSPHRGSVPVAWAVDPLLGELFPINGLQSFPHTRQELWNFYALSATVNDTFLAGVDGAGYVYVHSLSASDAVAYEARAAHLLQKYNIGVVDVGVANADYAAVTIDEIREYQRNARGVVAAFVNACGSSWHQPVNTWLEDGTPVINSVCDGPGQAGNYLFYYRSTLDPTHPAADLATRIRWAATQYGQPGQPLFLLAFGGLGVYGGYGDFFLFLQSVMADLAAASADGSPRKYIAVGAHELARLARLARP